MKTFLGSVILNMVYYVSAGIIAHFFLSQTFDNHVPILLVIGAIYAIPFFLLINIPLFLKNALKWRILYCAIICILIISVLQTMLQVEKTQLYILFFSEMLTLATIYLVQRKRQNNCKNNASNIQ